MISPVLPGYDDTPAAKQGYEFAADVAGRARQDESGQRETMALLS